MGWVANKSFKSAGTEYERGDDVPPEVWAAIPLNTQTAMVKMRFVVDPDKPDHRYRPRNGVDGLRDAIQARKQKPKARRRKKANG